MITLLILFVLGSIWLAFSVLFLWWGIVAVVWLISAVISIFTKGPRILLPTGIKPLDNRSRLR